MQPSNQGRWGGKTKEEKNTMFGIFSKGELKSGVKTAFWTAVGVVVAVPLVTLGVNKIKSMLNMSA